MEYVKSVLRTLLCRIVLDQQPTNDVSGSQLGLGTLKTEDPERASLSELPVELFLTIVKNVVLEAYRDHHSGYYGQLTKLCLVSKRWAETIHGAPEFWTKVNLHGSQEHLEMVLSRSRGLDLDIRGYVGSLSKAEMIGSWAHRWRLLDIRLDDEDIVKSVLANPAPRLQKLLLEGLGDRWVPPGNVFEGTAPKLEVVMLRNCPLPWTSPVLSGLKKLALYRIEEGAPDMNALLDVLAASLQLTSLEIVNMQIPISPSSRRLELPNLRLLRLEYLQLGVMTQMLSSTTAPLSAKCVLLTVLEDEEVTPLEDQLAVVSERLVTLAQSARDGSSTLTLQMGHEEEDFRGWSIQVQEAALIYNTEARHLGPLSITVVSPRKRHIEVLSHLAKKIRPYTKSSPPKLRLVDLNRTLPGDKSANLLCALYRTFPNARQIALIDTSYLAMIDALQRLFPLPTPDKSPLFPCLTTLLVKRRSHAEWAVWLLGHRRRTDKRGVIPLPGQLTMRLEGGSVDAKALQALKQLVPGALSLGNVQINWKAQQS